MDTPMIISVVIFAMVPVGFIVSEIMEAWEDYKTKRDYYM